MSPYFNPPVADVLSDHAFFDGIYVRTDRFVDPFWDRVLPIMPEEQVFMCRQMRKTINDLKEKEKAGLSVLDVGTGSGVLAIYTDRILDSGNTDSQFQVIALDKSERALEFAKMNSHFNNCTNVRFLPAQEYSLKSVPQRSQDIILVNPPFNPTHDSLENKVALHARGGMIGLDVFTDWLRHIPHHLNSDGVVIGYQMSPVDSAGEILALSYIRDALGDKSIINYLEVFGEWFDTRRFLDEQYSDHLNLVSEDEKYGIEAWINQQSEEYPRLTLVYYEAWKSKGSGEICKDLMPVWDHGRSWQDRVRIHRSIINTAQSFPEELTTQRLVSNAALPFLRTSSYEAHDTYWDRSDEVQTESIERKEERNRILEETVLNNISRYIDDSGLLKKFDFVLVDPTPVLPGRRYVRRINEECAIWPSEHLYELPVEKQKNLLRNLISEYQITTVLLQRSRLAPFFHPKFIYLSGWYSKLNGTPGTIPFQDKHIENTWNSFNNFEREYRKEHIKSDRWPFEVFENEFEKGQTPFVYSMARLVSLMDKDSDIPTGIEWRDYLSAFRERKQEGISPETDFRAVQYAMHRRLQKKTNEILQESGELSDSNSLFSVLMAMPLNIGTERLPNLSGLGVTEELPREYFGGIWIWAISSRGEPPFPYTSSLFDLARYSNYILTNFYVKELINAYEYIGREKGEQSRAIVSGHEAGAQQQFIHSIFTSIERKANCLPRFVADLLEGSISYSSLYLISSSQYVEEWLPWSNNGIQNPCEWLECCKDVAWKVALAKIVRNFNLSDLNTNKRTVESLLNFVPQCKIEVEPSGVIFAPQNYRSKELSRSLPWELLKWYVAAISNAFAYRGPYKRTVSDTLKRWDSNRQYFDDISVVIKLTGNTTFMAVRNKCDEPPSSPGQKEGGTGKVLEMIADWLQASGNYFDELSQTECASLGWEYCFEASMTLPVALLQEKRK